MTLQTGEFLGISVSVQTGTDASTAVYIDDELKYQITNLSSSDCTYYKFALDTDSLGDTFQLVINDTILYNNGTDEPCYGDLQIAYVETIATSNSCEAVQEDEGMSSVNKVVFYVFGFFFVVSNYFFLTGCCYGKIRFGYFLGSNISSLAKKKKNISQEISQEFLCDAPIITHSHLLSFLFVVYFYFFVFCFNLFGGLCFW